jgi:uncharacterized membrane protein YozB (DUF420 family)
VILYTNIANTLIFGAILVGTVLHGRRELHVKIMKACFVLDICLLLVVEFGQEAVEKALGLVPRGDLNLTILIIHVPLAVATLVWWFIQLVTGSKILHGRQDLLRRHLRHGLLFLAFRLGNLVTAWMLH